MRDVPLFPWEIFCVWRANRLKKKGERLAKAADVRKENRDIEGAKCLWMQAAKCCERQREWLYKSTPLQRSIQQWLKANRPSLQE